jgi:hypothetical protein
MRSNHIGNSARGEDQNASGRQRRSNSAQQARSILRAANGLYHERRYCDLEATSQ